MVKYEELYYTGGVKQFDKSIFEDMINSTFSMNQILIDMIIKC